VTLHSFQQRIPEPNDMQHANFEQNAPTLWQSHHLHDLQMIDLLKPIESKDFPLPYEMT
jgi:hypothetical protein